MFTQDRRVRTFARFRPHKRNCINDLADTVQRPVSAGGSSLPTGGQPTCRSWRMDWQRPIERADPQRHLAAYQRRRIHWLHETPARPAAVCVDSVAHPIPRRRQRVGFPTGVEGWLALGRGRAPAGPSDTIAGPDPRLHSARTWSILFSLARHAAGRGSGLQK